MNEKSSKIEGIRIIADFKDRTISLLDPSVDQDTTPAGTRSVNEGIHHLADFQDPSQPLNEPNTAGGSFRESSEEPNGACPTRKIYGFQITDAIRPCDGGLCLVFQDGLSACLPKGHPEYERIVRYAEDSVQHRKPVGFLVNHAGEVVELNHTCQSTVRFVNQAEEDPTRLMVGFWAYSPICYLTKDHPELERIHDTLLNALRTGNPVLLVNHMKMVEGETETWWKLLDVRPV